MATALAEDGQNRDSSGAPDRSGNWLWEQGVQRPLPRRTDFKPGRRPEVFLRPLGDQAGKPIRGRDTYVSAVAFDRYRDGIWSADAPARGKIVADGAGRIVLAGRPGAHMHFHEVVMSSDTGPEKPLVAIQGVVAVSGIPELERRSDGLWILPHREAGEGYRYRAESVPRRLADLTTSGGEPPGGVNPAWLELSDHPVMKRLAELALHVAGEGDRVERLHRIESHLRDRCRYSLATPNGRDLDPIENFLFEEKAGHCEYFATAAALMARAAGVPSRVVYGWTGGTWHGSAGWMVFRADEAHAWAEVLLDDGGWVVMDPTPPSRVPGRERESTKPLPALGIEDQEVDDELLDDGGAGVRLGSAFGSIGLLGLAGWLAGRRLSGRSGAAMAGPVRESWRRPVAGYLDEWRLAWSRLGRHDVTGGTLKQQIRTLSEAPPFAEALVRYHYRVSYEGGMPDAGEERSLAKAIREWSRQREGISSASTPHTKA